MFVKSKKSEMSSNFNNGEKQFLFCNVKHVKNIKTIVCKYNKFLISNSKTLESKILRIYFRNELKNSAPINICFHSS